MRGWRAFVLLHLAVLGTNASYNLTKYASLPPPLTVSRSFERHVQSAFPAGCTARLNTVVGQSDRRLVNLRDKGSLMNHAQREALPMCDGVVSFCHDPRLGKDNERENPSRQLLEAVGCKRWTRPHDQCCKSSSGSRWCFPNLFFVGSNSSTSGWSGLMEWVLAQSRLRSSAQGISPDFFASLRRSTGTGDRAQQRLGGKEWKQYSAKFPKVDATEDVHVYDATPDYLFHPHALGAISQALPRARFVVMLQDPVEMVEDAAATSSVTPGSVGSLNKTDWGASLPSRHWAEGVSNEMWRFAQCLRRGRALWDVGNWKACHEGFFQGHGHVDTAVARSMWVPQLDHLFQLFDSKNILLLDSDELKADPQRMHRRVAEFLGLPDTAWNESAAKERATEPFPPETQRPRNVIAYLRHFMRPHMWHLEQRIQCRLEWKTAMWEPPSSCSASNDQSGDPRGSDCFLRPPLHGIMVWFTAKAERLPMKARLTVTSWLRMNPDIPLVLYSNMPMTKTVQGLHNQGYSIKFELLNPYRLANATGSTQFVEHFAHVYGVAGPLEEDETWSRVHTPCRTEEKYLLVHMSDWARVALLYTKGGVYSDMDSISVGPFRHLQNVLGWSNQDVLPRGRNRPPEFFSRRISQGFMSFSPGHPFLQHLLTVIDAMHPGLDPLPVDSSFAALGPELLRDQYALHPELTKDIAVAHPYLFTPTRHPLIPASSVQGHALSAVVKAYSSQFHLYSSTTKMSWTSRDAAQDSLVMRLLHSAGAFRVGSNDSFDVSLDNFVHRPGPPQQVLQVQVPNPRSEEANSLPLPSEPERKATRVRDQEMLARVIRRRRQRLRDQRRAPPNK